MCGDKMKTEFECRILDIDVEDFKDRLRKVNAQKITERNMRRFTYDVDPKLNSWIRVRDDGERTTITYKRIHTDTIDGTKELEFGVDDFDKANQFIKILGYMPNAYQENRRISYVLNDVSIEIDSWPKIPTYIEIEGNSKEEIEKVVKLLGYSMDDTSTLDVVKIYAKYGLDIHSFKELKF